jgi:hypothetical protein
MVPPIPKYTSTKERPEQISYGISLLISPYALTALPRLRRPVVDSVSFAATHCWPGSSPPLVPPPQPGAWSPQLSYRHGSGLGSVLNF